MLRRRLTVKSTYDDGDADGEFKPWSKVEHLHVTDGFLGTLADDLRSSFDNRCARSTLHDFFIILAGRCSLRFF